MMRSVVTSGLIVVCLAFGVGCRSTPDVSAAPPGAETLKARGDVSAAPEKLPARLNDPRDIGAMFRFEAEHRPEGAHRAEDILADFRKVGVPLSGERQHLARPFGAKYCMGAHATDQVAISVCEYSDANAARTGQALSTRALASIDNRQVVQKDNLTLTVRLNQKTSETEATSEHLVERFRSL